MVPIAWSTRAVVPILEVRLQVLPSALGSPPLLLPTQQLDLNRRWPFTEPTTRSNILGGLGWPTFKSFFGSLDKKAAISACVSPCLGNEHGDTSQHQQNSNRRSNKAFRTDFARAYLELLAFLLMESFFLEHSLRQHLKRSLMKNWRA